ncbi:MAG TPA: S8/S53 family peptidase [Thermoanaerobaculia bacterium]|nr:S8/S53 family peptidase [Thermoanaerobaculia bacterium]
MRKQVLWLALCTGLGLSACAIGRPQAPAALLDTSKACASWRWIGISRPGAQCPDVPGWTVRPLFPQLAPVEGEQKCPGYKPPVDDKDTTTFSPSSRRAPVQPELECPDYWPPLADVPKPEVIRELNRFCVYEIAGGKKGLKEIPSPATASPELVRFDRDCAALSPSERYLEAKSWKTDPDPEKLLAYAGKPSTPLQLVHDERSVRLAFLDTQPTSEDVPLKQGRSPHGFTLAQIAQELVCSPEPNEQEPYKRCAAQITTRLALPILEFNAEHPKDNVTDLERGGFFGMQSDLAVAIRQEVDSWLAQRTEKSQKHLVLNLSLAWDGRLFGGLNGEQTADMKAGTQAVYRALQYAAGFDVLVLAAAGNQKLEPCVNYGPLLPAAWEETAPRENCCGEPDKKPAPLLYAVGGVQEDGSPLDNARPGGMPRRVAYGKTEVFEGSSVATAIVSSIAAVLWDANPDLKSWQVMDRLDKAGETLLVSADVAGAELPRQADFWFIPSTPDPDRSAGRSPFGAPPVRRLSLCSVLHLPCSPEAFPVPLAGDRRKVDIPKLSTKGSCQPWLLPQPDILPCPACDPPKN